MDEELSVEDTNEHRGTHSLKNELGVCKWVQVKCEKTFSSGHCLNLQ